MNPMTTPSNAAPTSLDTLFKFTAADLAANRQGQLSAAQQAWRAQANASAKTLNLIAGFVILGLAVLPLPMGLATVLPTLRVWPLAFLITLLLLWLGLWLPFWGWLGVRLMRGAPNIAWGDLLQAQGPINIVAVERTFRHKRHRTYLFHELHVGGEKFSLQFAAVNHFTEGDIYAVYYLARAR